MIDTWPERHVKIKHKGETRVNNKKKNNEGCLPQALSLKSSARLSIGDDNYSE